MYFHIFLNFLLSEIGFKFVNIFPRSGYFDGVVTKKCANGKYEYKFNDGEIKKYTMEQIVHVASLQRQLDNKMKTYSVLGITTKKAFDGMYHPVLDLNNNNYDVYTRMYALQLYVKKVISFLGR